MQYFRDFLKSQPTASTVHVGTALGNDDAPKRRKFKPNFQAFVGQTDDAKKSDWHLTVPVSKVDGELGIIYGWASEIETNGEIVTDTQGDRITEHDMLKAAHEFMLNSRVGGLMHADGVTGGDVVESLMFTRDLQKALGIDLKKVGWLIAYKPRDQRTLELAKSGALSAFSIGGRGLRVPVS